MKKLFTLFAFVLLCLSSQAASKATWADQFSTQPEVQALTSEVAQLNLDQFLSLTPKKYKEMTGQRLGLKKTIQLKAAQKFIKKQMKGGGGGSDIPKGLYILAAIFGWAWLVMGLMDEWEGKNWWVNLILTYLTCGIGGLIHALIKMKEYYGGGKK